MSDNARDTQFKYFANALWEELAKATSLDEMQSIIARRAYDLVSHSLGYSLEYLDECGKEISGGMGKRIMPSIPDMTELPKESS